VSFARYDIIVVPFPFTDRAATRRRPALVLSNAEWNRASGHLICAMITSAQASAWPQDVSITDLASAGLRTPCLVRAKLFTLNVTLVIRRAGQLCATDAARAQAALAACF
jgi:mRNA interferase MazF